MYKLVTTIVLIAISLNCSCQSRNEHCLDSVKIEGWIVTRYDKAAIEKKILNDSLMKKGDSYQIMIDIRRETFFIEKNGMINEDSIVDKIVSFNGFNQSKLFLTPLSNKTESYLKMVYDIEIDLTNQVERIINSDTCRMYTFEGDNNSLYNVRYIEGLASSSVIENNEINKIKLGLSDEIDRSKKQFEVVFIYHIQNIDCFLFVDSSSRGHVVGVLTKGN